MISIHAFAGRQCSRDKCTSRGHHHPGEATDAASPAMSARIRRELVRSRPEDWTALAVPPLTRYRQTQLPAQMSHSKREDRFRLLARHCHPLPACSPTPSGNDVRRLAIHPKRQRSPPTCEPREPSTRRPARGGLAARRAWGSPCSLPPTHRFPSRSSQDGEPAERKDGSPPVFPPKVRTRFFAVPNCEMDR